VSATQRLVAASVRVARVWRRLAPERRLAAVASIALFFTLFLDWYQETVIANGDNSLRQVSVSLTGWGAFSFVEAAVLLVAAGVLGLLFVRAEGRAFHVPGGDGSVITAAGLCTCLLIIWRIFDKEGTTAHGQYDTTFGVEWGIFVALGVGGLLTYAGTRIRLAHEPEPPLPGEDPASGPGPGANTPPHSQPWTAPSTAERHAGSGAGMKLDDIWARRSAISAGARPASDPAGPARPEAEPAARPAAAEPTPAGGRTRKRPRSVGAPAASAQSAAARPATTRPATTRPATARPATARPATARPATTRPATTRPATTRPATARPATTRPATDDPNRRVGPTESGPPETVIGASRTPTAEVGDADDQLTLRFDRPR